MDSDYDIQGMSSINVDSELQDDKEEQLAVLNLHMDHHHQHQYLLAVPGLYSFDPPDAWTVESSFGGDNSKSSDTFSPIFSTAAEQFQPHQVSVERPINLCTAPNNNLASQSDCDEALSGTPASSSTPRGSRTDQLRTNDDGTLPGASAGISNIRISPAVPALSTYNLQVGDDDHHGNNNNNNNSDDNASNNPMDTMREMIFRVAAMQPVNIDPESIKRPKRRNVRISKDPQSVAARHRRERISERIRILQRLVPGGTRMDTASMLDEAIHYVKFLKMQVQELESAERVGGFKRNFCNSGANISYLHPLFPNFCFIADSRAYYPNNYSLS